MGGQPPGFPAPGPGPGPGFGPGPGLGPGPGPGDGVVGVFLHYPAPDFWSVAAIAVEWVISVSLVLGIATRYGAALALVYVIIAVATAHRYWEFPQAQQGVQYIFFNKDLSILGGLLVLFVTGAGAFSLDARLGKD